jgi:DNA primase
MKGDDNGSAKECAPLFSPATATTTGVSNESVNDQQENAPLKFALQGIDASHPYLTKRGIRKETAETFGVGFFPGKGSMNGRIVFPIANARGDLVAYAGRTIDGSEPEYKFPAGFKKSLELFNLHRAIETGSKCVHLVEGFFDTMKVHQAGCICVVGLFGWCLSDAQSKLISSHFDEVVIMLDGNDVGRKGSAGCAVRLAPAVKVKLVWVPWGKEPDQLSSEEIRGLLG